MDEPRLQHAIEALLFAADEPLTTRHLKEALGVEDGAAVRQAVEALQAACAEQGRGIQIEEIAGGFRLLSNREFGDLIERLRKTERRARLSPPALETLAIIAYKQPVHRADIEAIRGVQVDAILRGLQERGLIRIVGRAEVLGRPFLYGTTRRFLEVFGLKDLAELPKAEELHIP
jgi:segregation and condensation protein B